MRAKRLKIMSYFLAFLGVFLVAAIFRISFLKNEAYSQSVAQQRTESITVKRHRGIFYDRNMIPLVENRVAEYTLKENGDVAEGDGDINIRMADRYGKSALAPHLIGYVDSDGTGVSGLEKYFDAVLVSDAESKVNVVTTASGDVASGLGAGFKDSNADLNSVKLTIDSHIQKISQSALEKSGFSGAVVVMNVKNSDILAMASSPVYDRNKISEHVNSDGTELINRATSAYNAGSIFKIITLASALENGSTDENYTCSGIYELGDKSFACHKFSGHGKLDFINAFSKSCNCAFYEMGLKTGAPQIIETAKAFGIGKSVLGYEGLGEFFGNLPDKDEYGIFETVNYSIGQGEILLTPVQAANMACIIANNGIANSVNVADCIIDSNGAKKHDLRKIDERRVISFETARSLQECMRLAVMDGTASAAKSDVLKIAGKTGTAETGWIENGENFVHGWFCGYFPFDNPKYAMAVLIENGRSGSESAVPVFKNIAEEIIKFYPVG